MPDGESNMTNNATVAAPVPTSLGSLQGATLQGATGGSAPSPAPTRSAQKESSLGTFGVRMLFSSYMKMMANVGIGQIWFGPDAQGRRSRLILSTSHSYALSESLFGSLYHVLAFSMHDLLMDIYREVSSWTSSMLNKYVCLILKYMDVPH